MVGSFEQEPPRLGQPRLTTLASQRLHLRSPDLIDRLAQVHGDVKPVEDVQGVARLLRDDLQVRLPHVAADEAQRCGAVAAEPPEELQHGLGAALLPDPEQAFAPGIDLVHQRHVAMAALPLNLVEADRFDAREIHVRPAPRDGHRDRPEYLVPTRLKDDGDVAPTEALGPAGEEPGVGGRDRVLPLRPRHGFDAHRLAGAAVDASHQIQEEDAQPPERHELKPTQANGVVVPAAAPTARTPRPAPRVRVNFHVQREPIRLFDQLDGPIDEPALLLDPIQDSLDLHPVARLRDPGVFRHLHCLRVGNGMRLIAAACARVEAAGAVDGTERRPPRLGKPTERVFHKLPHALFSSVKKAKTRNYKTPHRAWAELPTDSAEEAIKLIVGQDRPFSVPRHLPEWAIRLTAVTPTGC